MYFFDKLYSQYENVMLKCHPNPFQAKLNMSVLTLLNRITIYFHLKLMIKMSKLLFNYWQVY